MRSTTLVCVVIVFASSALWVSMSGVAAQKKAAPGTLPSAPKTEVEALRQELTRERLIRIIEPVIYPFQRLAESGSNWQEFFISCQPGLNNLSTELGVASIRCTGDKPFPESNLSGPLLPERVFGDRKISVTVKGFNTHERLCGEDAGFGDFRDYCGGRKKGTIRAVVTARFSVTTKIKGHTVTVSPVTYDFPTE